MAFPITMAEIAKTEAKTGFVFPIRIKLQMSKNNGGEKYISEDCWQLIPFLDSSDQKRLARTCNDIVKESALMREMPGFPTDAFVVAQNGTGDYLFILPKVQGARELGETIYLWDHETHKYEPVANSLERDENESK